MYLQHYQDLQCTIDIKFMFISHYLQVVYTNTIRNSGELCVIINNSGKKEWFPYHILSFFNTICDWILIYINLYTHIHLNKFISGKKWYHISMIFIIIPSICSSNMLAMYNHCLHNCLFVYIIVYNRLQK